MRGDLPGAGTRDASAREPGRGERASALLRSFAIQGSWNYRTLVGAGLAHALLPLLRRIHAGDPVALREALERHASSFNGHPYLCAMAVGALARLELDGHDPAEVQRFRRALMAPLGALGDRLVWSGWRPLCTLLAVLAWSAGLGAVPTTLLFLGLYNVGHVGLRIWAFRKGWEGGFEVGRILRGARLGRLADAMVAGNVLLLGLAAGIVALRTPMAGGSEHVLAAAGAATLVYLFPRLGGPAAILLLGGAWVLWLA